MSSKESGQEGNQAPPAFLPVLQARIAAAEDPQEKAALHSLAMFIGSHVDTALRTAPAGRILGAIHNLTEISTDPSDSRRLKNRLLEGYRLMNPDPPTIPES